MFESKDPSKLSGSAETKPRSEAAATRASYSSSANKWSESVFSSEVSLPATLSLSLYLSIYLARALFRCLSPARSLSRATSLTVTLD
jgi:hypothetical protein